MKTEIEGAAQICRCARAARIIDLKTEEGLLLLMEVQVTLQMCL